MGNDQKPTQSYIIIQTKHIKSQFYHHEINPQKFHIIKNVPIFKQTYANKIQVI